MAELAVVVEVPRVVLYVSSDYPEGSCEFKLIEEHERDHFAKVHDFAHDFTESGGEDYEKALREALSTPNRFCCGEESAEWLLQDEIRKALDGLVKEVQKDMKEYLESIDTAEVMREQSRRMDECKKKDRPR